MSTKNAVIPISDSPRGTQPEDKTTIYRLLDDEGERRELQNRISNRLRRCGVTGSMNEERTEEIFQQVCVRALEKETSFDPNRSDGHAWLYTIAFRLITDEHNANRKYKITCAECFQDSSYVFEFNEILPDPDIPRVQGTIASLSKKNQQIYEEYYVKSKVGRELANALECRTTGAARTRVRRFKQAFEKAFDVC